MFLASLQMEKGTPLLTLLKDPYILIAAGILTNRNSLQYTCTPC